MGDELAMEGEYERVDLVIIGGGVTGLVAAKTYLEINPSSSVVLLDTNSSIGGVWAKHRLYSGLRSNNMLGTFEYSDFPMDEATFGVKPGQHIPGHVMHSYFEKYVDRFGFRDCIRLDSKVEDATHRSDATWLITYVNLKSEEPKTTTLHASKLIVATGLTSQPYLPPFDGQDVFGIPLLHCRDLLRCERDVINAGQRIAIFGGTKSSWDAAYICATSGMQVDWIIRESGHGPIWMAPPYVTPLKKWLEKLVMTRLLTWFSPCIWGDADGFGTIRRYLHRTWLGRKIVDVFWGVLGNDIVHLNGYNNHPEVKKLKPWISPFWIASSLSILNYPTDFFELIKNGTIRMHIADIDRLSPQAIHLSDGQTIPTTALICSTGWRATPNLKFLPEGIEKQLGFPWSEDPLSEDLIQQANAEIFHRFPRLKNQPVFNPRYTPLTEEAEAAAPHPIRLCRFMVPPSLIHERSTAFLGMTLTISTTLIAQTQALWTTAFFNNCLSPSPTESYTPPTDSNSNPSHDTDSDVEWETALHTQFGKWRYAGGYGRRNPDFIFDTLPYIDLLLRDLGLRTRRKGSLLAECLEPYGPEDYRGLVREWLSADADKKTR